MATGVSKRKWQKPLPSKTGTGSKKTLSLCYEGKAPEEDILATPPSRVRHLWGTPGAPSRLFYGDNLGILALLLEDEDVRGQVRLIYIDPPFATGSVFKSRDQKDAYADLLTGAEYVEFLRQRLILLRELLAEDGSIYVHLDHNMAPYIKVIMDEVFGAKNFRNWITRKKCHAKNFPRRRYGNVADYILFYTKTDRYVWNRPFEPWDEEKAKREYPYVEPETGRRYKKVPLHAPGTRQGETGQPWRGMLPPPGKHWQYPPRVLDEMDARGEIYWSPTGNPRRKVYLDQSKGILVQDIWLNFLDAHNQNVRITGYPTEKNPRLLERLIQASSQPGDLVLDCFSGSGTTLAVASELRRRWIGADWSPEAIAVTLKRFALGLQPMGDYVRGKPKASRPLQPSLMPIRDFALYAVEPYDGALDTVLEEWKGWIGE